MKMFKLLHIPSAKYVGYEKPISFVTKEDALMFSGSLSVLTEYFGTLRPYELHNMALKKYKVSVHHFEIIEFDEVPLYRSKKQKHEIQNTPHT